MNATTPTTPNTPGTTMGLGTPPPAPDRMPPPPVRRAQQPPQAPRERIGGWSLLAVLAADVGIALVWFPDGGRGRPDPAGPSFVEVLGVLGGAGCGVVAVVLGIALLATAQPRGWSLAGAIAAIPAGLVACLMAAVVAFSG